MTQNDLAVSLIYTLLPDQDSAAKLAEDLVTERLAACVNMLPGAISIYEWQGKLERATEIACLIKTTRAMAPLVQERVAALHPYETPAIVHIEADGAATPFATWVAAQTKR